MSPKLVTFDAAGTLVRVRWSPAQLARECVQRLDLPVDAEGCAARFAEMLRARWPEYLRVNLARSEEQGDRFWEGLCADWLAEIGQPDSLAEALRAAVWDLLYGPGQTYFSLFDDVVPALERLAPAGVGLAVISNWDYSLRRILKMLGVYERFGLVAVSLEEGFEKPDPRIFQLVLDRFGVPPEEALHIGDDPRDDLEGARRMGMRALLVDRGRSRAEAPYIASLAQILESDAWTN